jgi:hypothetical protein
MTHNPGNPAIQSPPRNRINYIELLIIAWFIESCTLGPNLISQFVAPPTARTLFTVTTLAILILMVMGKIKPKRDENTARTNKIANLVIIGGFTVYIISLLLASVNSYSANIGDAVGRILLFVTFLVAKVCMTEKIFVKCMDRYCELLTIFSLGAIIVFLGVFILKLPPVNDFVSPEVERSYQNYILAFVEAEVDGMDGFKRAGSFYDEPGTFAMFLTPAIFWTMLIRPSKFKFFTLLIADFLTFSIGGWMAFAIALIYVVKVSPDIIKKYQFVIISTFVVLGIIVCFNLLIQVADLGWLADYYNYKFEGSGSPEQVSSADIRQNEIDKFFTTLAENPMGYGTKSPQIPIFSVGFMASSIEGGLLGAIGYCSCFGGMIMHLFQHFLIPNRWVRSRYTIPILGSILSLIVMSFQRIDMLSFYSGIFMLSFLVNCPLPQPEQKTLRSVNILPDVEEESAEEIEEEIIPESIPQDKPTPNYLMGNYMFSPYLPEEDKDTESTDAEEEPIDYRFF